MRITLNLATRPYADIGPAIKLLRIAMAVLAVIAIGLGLGLRAFHQQAEEARKTEQQVQSKIDAINRERQGYQELMRQPANAQLLAQATTLNQLIDEKTFSWTLAMEDLETVLPGGVQATTLEPARDAKTGVITLKLRVVGARNRAVDLVENLEHSKHFLLPKIVAESIDSTSGPGERVEPPSASNRVNFELQAQYNPAETLDHKAQQKQEHEKLATLETRAGPGHVTPPSRVVPKAHVAPGQKPLRPSSTNPARNKANRLNPNLKSGGPR
jgi:type IV pilus assembly protein PilN